jgi:hypothetical protein
MRRASLAAPILLIAIGALFLLRNLYPEIRLVDYFARFWPWLLVIWGGVRAFEVASWAASGRPLPRAGVSGGEWVLAIFLVLLGSGIHTARTFRMPNGLAIGDLPINVQMFGERFEYPVSMERPVGAAPVIVLQDFRGDARIIGADSSTVKITGTKFIRSLDRVEADREDKDSGIEIVTQGSRTVIRPNRDWNSGPSRFSATLDITVPHGASIQNESRWDSLLISRLGGSVEVKGRGSDVEIEQVDGPVNISGRYTGNVILRQLAKPFHFKGTNSEVDVEKITGELRIDSGDVRGENLVGPVNVTARSHDVTLSNFSNGVNVSVERGDIDLRPQQVPLSRMEIKSRSGDIRLSLPEGSQFAMNASSNRGEITNEFGGGLKVETDGRKGSLKGNVGKGPEIAIQTERGEILVRKSSAGERLPEPKSDVGKKTGGVSALEKIEQ